MISTASTTVLIVGAGPTGLTLACDLARRGVDHRILDAAPEPFLGSRGKGLQPRTLEVFDDLGVIDDVLAAGGNYPKLAMHWPGFALGTWRMFPHSEPTPSLPYPNTWMLPQWKTEEILRARLAQLGGKVEQSAELTSFTQDERSVTAAVSRGGAPEEIRADYLIGADGGKSRVRKTLGVPFAGVTSNDERLIVADVRIRGVDRTYWHVWPLAKGGVVTICPLAGTDFFQLTAKVGPDIELPAEDALQTFLDRALGRRAGIRIEQVRWRSLFRPNVRMVERFRVKRVFLAGDAAHVHPPAGGQGLNTGVQDAYNLGWKLALAARGAPDALLDTYETERLPIAAHVLGLSSKLHRTRSLRRGKEVQQLGVAYRESPLSCELRRSPGPVRAGDRAPGALCTDAKGDRARLLDAFRGPHFTLLAFGAFGRGAVPSSDPRIKVVRVLPPGAPRGDAHDALSDAGAHARKAYAVAAGADALVLVRPDGVIGLFASPGTSKDIADYMTRTSGMA